ncbi:HD domain-containing protein [Paucibacter sp. M5-1]|uniref:HD domain-containing protein n=1 Tax=Paucibacter sp. M5-1 TaxID=3015998 RepID=UPI002FCDF0B6
MHLSSPLSLLSFEWAWREIGARPDSAAELHRTLLAAYAEPHRHYHSQQHLAECLQSFEKVQALAQRPAEVALALWFHDAVYEVKRGDNEEQSALWARRALQEAAVPAEAVQRVFELVMVTRHSQLPAAGDPQLLVDIDLSILGAPEPRF